MQGIGLVVLAAALVGQAMLLGANAFEAVVDVPNWRSPDGLVAYRRFIAERNAGHFYRVLSPATVLTLLAALALGWAGGTARDALVGGALVAAIAAEAFTAAFFFPRNRQLFFEPIEDAPGARSAALVDQWARANLVRVAIVAAGLGCGLAGLLAQAS
jgi:hypothetical protein